MSGILGAETKAGAIETEARIQEINARMNERFAEFQAKDALRRGENQADAYKQQAQQVIGKQRAAMAANGVEINSGTALEIQMQTAEVGEINALQAETNAMREAFGYRMAAHQQSSQAMINSTMAKARASSAKAAGMINTGFKIGAAIATNGASLKTTGI